MTKISVVILFFLSLTFYAQTGSVSGEIIDKNSGESIPYATIVVASDNTTITGGLTNDSGGFSVTKIPLGAYHLEVHFIGYKTIKTPISITKTNRKLNLGKIAIEEDAIALDNIEVTAERSTITQKIDRKIITIGKDLTTVGASASDIMTNIPSVSVNQDGEISLRGNENVRVLVDGKPTNINATDLLQQIPSTSIKSIELITNPSAKYNPEGMSGIINIVLKKNSNLGFNGNVSTGITFGEKTRFNTSLGLNYRSGKFNIYGNYGNRLGKQVASGSITRTIEGTNQSTRNIYDNTSHLFKVGIDYFINDRNTLSLYTNQNLYERLNESTRQITFYNAMDTNFMQLGNFLTDNTNSTYNADFKHDFSKDGHNIELEVDYNTLNSHLGNGFAFTGKTPNPNYIETIDDTRTNTTVNLDYVNPVSENATLELGIETRLRRTDNTYITNNSTLKNSIFSYDRDILSFYTTWSQKFDKWQYNLGVRLEDYNVNAAFTPSASPSETFSQNLFNIYPSGFLKYTPDEARKNSYQISVSRRIDRPSLNQINPIRQITTPQIIAIGNPELNPQFTNSVELNYSRKLTKGNITIGGFYRRINDEINRIGYFDTIDPNVLILDYDNFDSNDAYGLELSSSYRPTKWWNFNASFDVYSRTQKGDIENESVEVNNTLLNAKVNNSFKATKDITFQLFTFYSGPQNILQYQLKSNFFMNAGARYNFAKGKATFSVNFNDIFRSQRFAFKTYRTIFQEGEFRRDSRTVFFGLSYRFGGGKNKALKRKKRDKNIRADKFL